MAELPQARTSRIYRIAELIVRYRPTNGASGWQVVDMEKSETLPAKYADEAMAKAGARLSAACDIHALFDSVKR